MTVAPTLPSWTVYPEADAYFRTVVARALARCPEAAAFAADLHRLCGVRLPDIVIQVAYGGDELSAQLQRLGWRLEPDGALRHRGSSLPEFRPGVAAGALEVTFRCESVRAFLAINAPNLLSPSSNGPVERSATVWTGEGALFRVVDMDWPDAVGPALRPAPPPESLLAYRDRFDRRARRHDSLAKAFLELAALVDDAVEALGSTTACSVFLQAERGYWMDRCVPGRLVKSWQDAAGVGWCNIDHYTYDCSREGFADTIAIFERLGFQRREVFYAGADAGWGSQVLEHPGLACTIFADIDLTAEELGIDLAHERLRPLHVHRRAGLWCAMHGESLFDGGLNHVAALYDQAATRRLLSNAGISTMAPFSDFPHLYQELTYGDRRAVRSDRLLQLTKGGHITRAEAEDFLKNWAIATHFENMERNAGYKGFNQPGIDQVLRVIDPRVDLADLPLGSS